MEHVSNKGKAKEICGCGNCYYNLEGIECLKDNGILCCLKPCLKDTLQAMQWKDEQEIEFLQSLMFQASTQQALGIIINNRIKLLKGE